MTYTIVHTMSQPRLEHCHVLLSEVKTFLLLITMARKKSMPKEDNVDQKEGPPKDSSKASSVSSTAAPAASPQPPREPIKVNKYNLTELKNACDDSLRKVLPSKLLNF
jgi:hypothetical protein